jgi:energy-coupling factor transporter ATP-binding protein EcfA2
MLKRIRLTDFKSFVDEEVELAPLTLLVGANASGKSNFLDAIRFLQGLSMDLTVGEILNGEESSQPDAWPGLRGRIQEAARIGTSEFVIAYSWVDTTCVEVGHRVVCRTEPVPAFVHEGLNLFGPQARIPEDYPLSPIHPESLVFLRINPDSMRGYGRRKAPLGNEGKNVSGVLADICADQMARESLVAWLTELCAPELEGIDFLEVRELGDVMAIFVEKGGRRISARSISDGTLHFLGTLLALRTAEPGSVFLIEEIEDGLHPTRIRLLVEYLEAVTRERNIQVIATTHSPVILEWLSDEALRNVVVFGRVPEHEGTLMRRLGDLPHFGETVARAGIDELFTTGWLEMAL